jgi:hypothetical protein
VFRPASRPCIVACESPLHRPASSAVSLPRDPRSTLPLSAMIECVCAAASPSSYLAASSSRRPLSSQGELHLPPVHPTSTPCAQPRRTLTVVRSAPRAQVRRVAARPSRVVRVVIVHLHVHARTPRVRSTRYLRAVARVARAVSHVLIHMLFCHSVFCHSHYPLPALSFSFPPPRKSHSHMHPTLS